MGTSKRRVYIFQVRSASMTDISIIGREYLPQIIQMHRLKTRMGGIIKPEEQADDVRFLDKYFTESREHLLLGAITDGVLTSCLSVIFSTVKQQPAWVIGSMLTKEFNSTFRFHQHDLNALVKTAFEIAERRGCRTYYYAIASKFAKIYAAKWQKNNLVPVGRYELFVDAVVPPDSEPENRFYWNLIGRRRVPIEVTINRRELFEHVLVDQVGTPHPLELVCTFKDPAS